MFVRILATIDLGLLVVTAALGFISLTRWLRHRNAGFPTPKVATHVALQVVSIGLWIAFISTGLLTLAWTTFVVITVGQVFGDLLMFASYRARHPEVAKPGYQAVSGDVLGFARPVAAFHALVGALAWFGMLAICIIASLD